MKTGTLTRVFQPRDILVGHPSAATQVSFHFLQLLLASRSFSPLAFPHEPPSFSPSPFPVPREDVNPQEEETHLLHSPLGAPYKSSAGSE